MNGRLKRLISLTISVCLVLSLVVVPASAAGKKKPPRGNVDNGGDTGGSKQTSSPCGFSITCQGYRMYITSGSITNGTLKIESPVIDLIFDNVPKNARRFLGTEVGNGQADPQPKRFSNQASLYVGKIEPAMYCTASGGKYYYHSNGAAFRDWMLKENSHNYSNVEALIAANFGEDVYKKFIHQKCRLVVEPIIWYLAGTKHTGIPLPYYIYGNTQEIVSCLSSNPGCEEGGYSPSVSNDALPHSVVLNGGDTNIGYRAPVGGELSGIQSDDAILNHHIGFGLGVFFDPYKDEPPVTSPPVTSPPVTSDDGHPEDEAHSPSPPVPDVPVGPEIPVPSNSDHDKPDSVFSHYASASYTKSANFNLNLTSTQWSLSKRATSGKDGWQGKNQVLPGGAIYSLNTDKTYVKLNTWQGYWGDGESAAVHKHKDFLSQAENALDNWQVTQYVNSNTGAGNAFGGMQVASGGKSLSALGLKNKTSSESKYYLRDGTNNNKANESDLDVIAAGSGYAK